MRALVFLFLLIFSSSFAQNAEELFGNANTLYKEGSYVKAIKIYEDLIKEDLVSSELYFNLGNCYYKTNKVGPAIFNYEKALQLNPLNKDAENNLVFAKRLSLDRIEELPKTFLQKFNQNYISKLSYETWAWLCILLSFTAALLFIAYYFSANSGKKRLFFSTSIISFLCLLVFIAITFHQYNKERTKKEAIVYATEVSVKNEPTKNAEEAFSIHEGTKLLVLDGVDDWSKIQLLDGKIGWLKTNQINLLQE